MKNRLREIREKQGKTIAEVAKATHQSDPQVSRHETGKLPLKIEMLLVYADYYGVGFNEIVDVPLSGKKPSKIDESRMDAALGFIVEACDAHKVNVSPKQIGLWATDIYNKSIEYKLGFLQMKGLAYDTVNAVGVKDRKTNKK